MWKRILSNADFQELAGNPKPTLLGFLEVKITKLYFYFLNYWVILICQEPALGWGRVLGKECLGVVKQTTQKSNHGSELIAYALIETDFQTTFSLLCFLWGSPDSSLSIFCCYARKCLWISKDHQGAISDAIALGSFYDKLGLGLFFYPTLTQQDKKAEQPRTLNRTKFYRKYKKVGRGGGGGGECLA